MPREMATEPSNRVNARAIASAEDHKVWVDAGQVRRQLHMQETAGSNCLRMEGIMRYRDSSRVFEAAPTAVFTALLLFWAYELHSRAWDVTRNDIMFPKNLARRQQTNDAGVKKARTKVAS